MDADAVLTLVTASTMVVLSALGWALPRHGGASVAVAALLVAGLAALGLLALLRGPVTGLDALGSGALDALGAALLVDLFVVAVAGGGPLTAAVLSVVDRGSAGRLRSEHAEEVLRGGAWIGAFERTAVFAAVLAGWPEGLAVLLALKGLGRYSELRADAGDSAAGAGPAQGRTAVAGGVAERFIIGTFASVLWAIGCAGVLVGLTW